MEDKAIESRDPALVFRIGDKVWLNLRNKQAPLPKKKLAWINAKYSITKMISPHVVELDVPSRIWPCFHINLLRQVGTDSFPSQITDDGQPPPIFPPNLDDSDFNAVPE